MEAKTFYGDAYGRAKDTSKLDKACERLTSALKSEENGGDPNGRLIQGMIQLACKSEAEAFVA